MKRIDNPPKLAAWLLKKIYGAELFDEISGDLLELYNYRCQAEGRWPANFHYLKDVLLSLRNIGLARKPKNSSANSIAMVRNLITIAFRSLKKRASYTFLNVAGLALSITLAFLLWIYVKEQYSYDRQYALADRIYRVGIDCDMNGKRDVYCNLAQPVAPALKGEYPEVEETLRIAITNHTETLEFNGRKVKSEQIFIVEPTVFKLFNREFIEGIPSKALIEPNTIVISEALALKIFGEVDVLGKTLQIPESKKYLKVTGVIKDEQHPTHLPMEAMVSWATYPEMAWDRWYGGHDYAYVLLNDRSTIHDLEAKMPAFFAKYMKKTFDSFNGKGRIFFQPVTSIHLSKEYVWEPYPHGNAISVTALTLVAIFLIVFAGINYVNLATARAAERAREVGVRKVLGSSKSSLWAQFLSESLILSLSSGTVAMFLSWILVPYFNQISGINLETRLLFTLTNFRDVFFLAAGIGVLAGLFPAFYLSSVKTLEVLKGGFTSNRGGDGLRKTLVTSQYIIAALLISSIILVYQQTIFVKNKDVGFVRENLVSIHIPTDSVVTNHIPVFVNELKASSHILAATITYLNLHKEADSFSPTMQNEDGTTFQMGADLIFVDADFVETMGATLKTGRNFRKDLKNDGETSILINEAAVKKFGWEENPLGGKLAAFTPREPARRNVIGVVKDFHLGVSYQLVHPTIIFLSDGDGSNLYLRIRGNEVGETLAMIKSKWQTYFPSYNIEYSFVERNLESLYNNEEKFLSLLTIFCFATLLIASIGVIGLISYTTQLRKKEIAIRKVLGSSFRNIIALLSGKFIKLLFTANLISIPIGWYVTGLWLSNFDYRIERGIMPFVISFSVCLFFTVFSLLFHTVQAAIANPVDSLKYE